MSPIASSMPAELTQGLDSLIRPWVRHPNTDAPSQSVCYQILPAGRAALAWRFRIPQAAERDDGAQGRPLVSRVLVGQASLLTPDVAIALCRTGLPDEAGLPPGQVPADAELPPVSADLLADLVRARASALDKEAAHERGLPQTVIAALSRPDMPLAIQLRDPYIFAPPNKGQQGLLLWGLWRIAWPLLDQTAAMRGWSFSTFELPMGDMDASTLPDIVFRLAQAASQVPPATPRREIRVRPGDHSTPTGSRHAVQLAEWLISEYRKSNGDELAQLISDSGQGQSLDRRLRSVYDVLRSRWAPAALEPGDQAAAEDPPPAENLRPTQGPPPAQELTAREDLAASADNLLAGQEVAAQDEPVNGPLPVTAAEATPSEPTAAQHGDAAPPGADSRSSDAADLADPSLRDSPQREEAHGAPVPAGQPGDPQDPLSSVGAQPSPSPSAEPGPDRAGSAMGLKRDPQNAPELTLEDYQKARHPDEQPTRSADGRPHSLRSLLEGLDSTADSREFHSVLQELLEATADVGERRELCREMPRHHWYISAFERHGYQECVNDLAGIFRVLVIPDLGRGRIGEHLASWVRDGPPQVTAALLAAAKAADQAQGPGLRTFRLMTGFLGEAGLEKLLEVSHISFEWPDDSQDHAAKPGQHRAEAEQYRAESGRFPRLRRGRRSERD